MGRPRKHTDEKRDAFDVAFRVTFAQRLANARHVRKVTQRELAELIGVSNALVSQWESNGARIFFEDVAMISDALDVPLDYFAGFVDSVEVKVEI